MSPTAAAERAGAACVVRRVAASPPALLGELLAASESEGYAFVRRVVDEWASGEHRFAGPGESLLGAFLDGRLVGIAGLMRDPRLADPAVGRLRNVYVLPEARGLGVGEALTRTAMAIAATHFARVRLRSASPRVARLYERVGFRPIAGDPQATHVFELADSALGAAGAAGASPA